jgi:hypothetical protein
MLAGTPRDDLIAQHSGVMGLDERGLAADLRGKSADVVTSVLDKLAASHDDDDVAFEYMRAIPSDPAESALAPENPAVLRRLRTALLGGGVAGAEREQAARIDKVLGDHGTPTEAGLGERLVGIGGDVVETAGEAGSQVAAAADQPFMPLAQLWRAVPEATRMSMVDRMLAAAAGFAGSLSGGFGADMMRRFLLGGIKEVQGADPPVKLAFVDRLVDLAGGGDTLTKGFAFAQGILVGLWDTIRGLFWDIPKLLLWDLPRLFWETIWQAGGTALEAGGKLLGEAFAAAYGAVEEMLSDPPKAAVTLFALIQSAKAGALEAIEQAGRGLARSMVRQRERLGEIVAFELGRQATPFLIDAIVALVTQGLGVALTRGLWVVQQVARLLQRGAKALRPALKLMSTLFGPLARAVRAIAGLFTKSRFGTWLGRLLDWLDGMATAVTAALILHAEGAPDPLAEVAEMPPVWVEEEGDGKQVLVMGTDAAGATELGAGERARGSEAVRQEMEPMLVDAGYTRSEVVWESAELVVAGFASPRARIARIRLDTLKVIVHPRGTFSPKWWVTQVYKHVLGEIIRVAARVARMPDGHPKKAEEKAWLDRLGGYFRNKAAEGLGMVGMEGAAKQHPEFAGGTRLYTGQDSGTVDAVYKVPDPMNPKRTLYKVIEEKGTGRMPIDPQDVKGRHIADLLGESRFGAQGSPSYLFGTLETMRARGGDDAKMADELVEAWRRGDLEYWAAATHVGREGIPAKTAMARFSLGSHDRLALDGSALRRFKALAKLGAGKRR